MNGIILLEGADATGKTSLANHIVSQFPNAEYLHLGKPNTGNAWSDHKNALLLAISRVRQGKLMVIDRLWLSEAIYGAVYRDGSEYPFTARHLDRLMYRFGALRIICAPPVDYVVQSHKRMVQEREELYTDRMYEVAKRYLDVWEGVEFVKDEAEYSGRGYLEQLSMKGGVADKIGWYKYDVTTDGTNMDHYVSYLKHQLSENLRLLPAFYEDTDNMTGWARRQAVVLVGDRSSSPESHWPFLANSGSSLYLAKMLHRLEADESRVCFVNANGPSGGMILRHGRLGCGRIIALGRAAEQALEREKIVYDARVRHPQHARRFTHNDASYEQELREAFNGFAGVRKP